MDTNKAEDRRIMWAAAFLLCAGIVVAGCDKKSPVAPTPPSVTAISVSGPDTVLLGGTASYTAAIAGGAPGATCAWGQDAPAVGVVANGTFTAASNGAVTIWCEADGVRGAKLIRVVPNFAGGWSGTYRVTGCSASGFFAQDRTCDEFWTGRSLPFSAVLSQTGTTVTGSFRLGSITAGQQSGAIVGDGFTMLLTHDSPDSIRLQSGWSVSQRLPGQMTGSMTQFWASIGISGDMRVDTEIATASRAGADPGLLTPASARLDSLPQVLIRIGQ